MPDFPQILDQSIFQLLNIGTWRKCECSWGHENVNSMCHKDTLPYTVKKSFHIYPAWWHQKLGIFFSTHENDTSSHVEVKATHPEHHEQTQECAVILMSPERDYGLWLVPPDRDHLRQVVTSCDSYYSSTSGVLLQQRCAETVRLRGMTVRWVCSSDSQVWKMKDKLVLAK